MKRFSRNLEIFDTKNSRENWFFGQVCTTIHSENTIKIVDFLFIAEINNKNAIRSLAHSGLDTEKMKYKGTKTNKPPYLTAASMSIGRDIHWIIYLFSTNYLPRSSTHTIKKNY